MGIDKTRLGAGLLAAALAGYWYCSPYVTVYQLQAAARAGDAEAFNRHVDYPQLRDNVKGQLTSMAAEPSTSVGDIVASKLGQMVVGSVTDAFVRPEAVMLAMRSGVFKPQPKHAGTADDGAPKTTRWHTTRNGLNAMVVYLSGDDANRQIGLVLHRQGLVDWKLVNIRLPADVRQP